MISIIIPVHNHYNELEKCLDSISKQTFKDYEIIVVDDEFGVGANTARNFGFQESHGNFLLFCDADIIMEPVMLEQMINALESNPQSSYTYASFNFGWKKFKLWPFDASRLRKMPYIHTTSLIRREHFPMFDEQIKRLQDWDLFLTMLEKGHKGVWIPKVLFGVKPRKSGMSKWLPGFMYSIPWIKSVREYKKAERVIKKKHEL
ncbi:MAG: glycosyltransferase family 2 protein [Patescibacteria group bacterium]|nr:glycosyltransferase family 2 protein [Patescibacteria group bacterium]